ncbi:MAG: hypothetical protein AB1529_04645 [Candidatus Micrarchaeota archaeon]
METAIDVAELFLEATEKFTLKYYGSFEIDYRNKETEITVEFNDEDCSFIFIV